MKTRIYQLNGSVNLRIALVADLHDKTYEDLLIHIQSKSPDIIVIAGDIVYGSKLDRAGFTYTPHIPMLSRFPNADRFIHAAPTIAPTFLAYGNHEWMLNEADFERIKAAGATILHNSFVQFKNLAIGGLSSPDVTNYWVFQKEWRTMHPEDTRGNLRRSYYYWKTHEERKTVDSAWLGEFKAQAGYKILICHHPEYWSLKEPRLCEHPIDLVLSGHAHGGQIRIGNQGLYASGQGWLPKFTGGIHHGRYGDIIISRGLSNTVPAPRLFNPTELVYVDITPEEMQTNTTSKNRQISQR